MKTILSLASLLAALPLTLAAPPRSVPPPAPPPPPPVVQASPGRSSPEIVAVVLADTSPPVVTVAGEPRASGAARSPAKYVYEQKPISGRPALVTPDQAKAIIDRFKRAYASLGRPRFVIYVNRPLIDEESGMKLSARTEQTRSIQNEPATDLAPAPSATRDTNAPAGAATLSTPPSLAPTGDVGEAKAMPRHQVLRRETVYRFRDPKTMSLADKQTVRDVERLFGRPLRLAGASVVDQDVATALTADLPAKSFSLTAESDLARRERAALSKAADVALEVLISSRTIVVPEITGDQAYAVPDIQATAIRLRDARILGQASAADLVGKGQYAAWVAQHFDVNDIAEATALSLMEDMLVEPRPGIANGSK